MSDPHPPAQLTLTDYNADMKRQLDEVARARGLTSGEELIADIAADPAFAAFDRVTPIAADAEGVTFTARLRKQRGTIAERCEDFDAANPEVYREIRRLALEAVRSGRRRLGIKQLIEVARWYLATDARDDAGGLKVKVNNNYAPHWARRLMAEEAELAGVFETRELREER